MAIDFEKFLPPENNKVAQKSSIDFNKFLPKESQPTIQPSQPTQTPFSTVHKLQGGGALNIGSSTSDLINTGHTTYAGTPTKKGYERADIVPVSLGGSNQTKENITYEPYSTVEKIKDKLAEIAGKNYVPQTATDKYLKNEILPQYKAGKITLNEARVKAVGFLSDQQQGLKKSTLANYPTAVKDTVTGVIKGLIEQYTKPSENIQKAEKLLGASAPTNKFERVVTAPIRTAEKIFIRTFGPMVDPLAQDIGEIAATREISNKVARGEMPASALDDINVLKKTFPQIVGDVSQTVLAAYIPNFAGEALGVQTTKNVASKFGPAFAGEVAGRTAGRTILEKVATGGVAGLKAGTLFGGAQVLSSGSKELKEISNIIGQNIIFGTLLGGVTSGLTGILGKVKEVKAQIKDPRMKDIWSEVENSVKERVNNPKIVEKEIDVKLDNQIKLLDAPQQNKMIGTPEPKLLEAPQKRAETQGQGFVMTDKANKEKVALIKTINTYREELKSFIKNPTPTKRAKVEVAKTTMDEGIANWNKPPEKTPFQQIHERVQSGKQVEAPKIQETKAPLAQLHEQFQAEQAKTITPTEPLTKTQESASVKKQATEAPVTQKTVKSTPEPVKTQGEAISGQIKPTIIDPDLLKKQANDYNPANHEFYSKMAKEQYARELKTNPNPVVKFTAGGSGSGKSELVIKRIGKDFGGIIMDKTLSDVNKASADIDLALKAGKKVEIHGILPRIESAWRFIQKREARTGRGVPLKDFIDKHIGFVDTLKQLIKKYPQVEFTLKDTRNIFSKEEALKSGVITDRKQILDVLDSVKYDRKTIEKTLSDSNKTTEFQSRVFERMKAEHPELTGDLTVERMNLEKDAQKAVELVAKDKQKAYDIAMGKEKSGDVTATAINIALAEQALKEGNNELYAKLITNRSLAQTRRGQEIVAEKGSVTDNSVSRYVKELIAQRLEKVGKNYLGDLTDNFKKKSTKERATAKIDNEVGKLETRIKQKKLDVKTALSLLDKLTCLT